MINSYYLFYGATISLYTIYVPGAPYVWTPTPSQLNDGVIITAPAGSIEHNEALKMGYARIETLQIYRLMRSHRFLVFRWNTFAWVVCAEVSRLSMTLSPLSLIWWPLTSSSSRCGWVRFVMSITSFTRSLSFVCWRGVHLIFESASSWSTAQLKNHKKVKGRQSGLHCRREVCWDSDMDIHCTEEYSITGHQGNESAEWKRGNQGNSAASVTPHSTVVHSITYVSVEVDVGIAGHTNSRIAWMLHSRIEAGFYCLMASYPRSDVEQVEEEKEGARRQRSVSQGCGDLFRS